MEPELEKELSSEEIDQIDDSISRHYRATTHREKLKAQGIEPFTLQKNWDLILYLTWGVLLGTTVTLILVYCALGEEKYFNSMVTTAILTFVLFPVSLAAKKGDASKALRYFWRELLKYLLGKEIDETEIAKSAKDVEDFANSIKNRLTR